MPGVNIRITRYGDNIIAGSVAFLHVPAGHMDVSSSGGQFHNRLLAKTCIASSNDDHFAIDSVLFAILAALDIFSVYTKSNLLSM